MQPSKVRGISLLLSLIFLGSISETFAMTDYEYRGCRFYHYPNNTIACVNRNLHYIPEDIPRNVTIFKFVGNSMSTLGNNFNKYDKCVHVIIHNNGIQSIGDDAFDGLYYLEELNLNYNKLSNLPRSLMRLDRLKILMLWSNNFKTIYLTGWFHSKSLNIGSNPLEFIPELNYYDSLEHLDISYTKIKTTVERLKLFEALKTLNFEETPSYEKFIKCVDPEFDNYLIDHNIYCKHTSSPCVREMNVKRSEYKKSNPRLSDSLICQNEKKRIQLPASTDFNVFSMFSLTFSFSLHLLFWFLLS